MVIAYAVGAGIVALVWISAALTRADRRRRLLEEGRRLATRRDDLIAAGVDPADLLIPLAPDADQ